MKVTRFAVAITTDGSGDGTGFTDRPVYGHVSAIRYVKDDYANGMDFVATGEASGIAILTGTNVNASATFAPRHATHDVASAASLYAAVGEPVEGLIPVAGERVKIVVDEGGASKSGTFHVYVIE